ncbi:MAG: TRAP transporter large permease [Alphaproteobacteria bacterium]|jgi:tripartite ATP-independent transporter DctM subunit|nr:TRAP transporter large permease [Alphaproteobacteria bacterium]MBT4086496.1 TRAP transporter large permease [Alphaproteobacteria bacterium]MBT4546476.1 TRAP transporter large permease [Alphaproteobacteria bacterium]MBT7745477.1 TRAP transporter large permease [Alphaproteobacteria bacterium]
MDESQIGLIGVGVLVFLVFTGMRVVYAASLVGLGGLVAILGWDAGAGIIGTIPHSKSVSYTLSVLPMFILIGFLAFHAGFTNAIFDAARKWIGWVPGGLAVASVFAAAGFAAVSGASTATAAVFSRIAIPEMLKYGYDRKLAAGVVAAGGTLASLIPPSAILVIYAVIVEQSVGALLLAGFIPGIFSALIYVVMIIGMAKRNPESAPAVGGYSWAERFRAVPGTLPIVFVIGIIFSSLYLGWATPTEAGALGAGVVFVVALLHGMRWKSFQEALLDTAKLTAMIFSIIWGVLAFVRFLGFAGLPEAFATWVVGLPLPPMLIMIGILLFYAVLGMFMDAIGMLLLTLPVVYPAVIALGFDPIWFGIIVVKMAEICLITPPIGLNCYVVNGVRPDIPLQDVFKGIAPFFVADVVTVGLLLAFPGIILWLPNLVMGS